MLPTGQESMQVVQAIQPPSRNLSACAGILIVCLAPTPRSGVRAELWWRPSPDSAPLLLALCRRANRPRGIPVSSRSKDPSHATLSSPCRNQRNVCPLAYRRFECLGVPGGCFGCPGTRAVGKLTSRSFFDAVYASSSWSDVQPQHSGCLTRRMPPAV